MQRVWSTYLDSSRQQLQAREGTSSSPHLPQMDSNSPRTSIVSRANSAYSHTGSTRPILADSRGSDFGVVLEPPFAGSSYLFTDPNNVNSSSVSLSVNYLPNKFSASLLTGTRQRKGLKSGEPNLPKRGGGIDAFRSNEARMPNRKRLRWNKFKWILFTTNLILTLYAMVAVVFCLITWFNVWKHADVVRVGNRPELIISTIAATLGLLTAVIGWAGILLNNRSFLAVYTLFTWVTFAFLVTPGYITFRRRHLNLEGKINSQWSRQIGADGRVRIQNQLLCCGYFSPFVEATVSQTCYARSILPGCKGPYLAFQKMVLERWYTAAFLLVPVQILVIVSGLLCSNHVTYRFGKGMMPEAYRLNMSSMAVIMDNYASQLADHYGSNVATDIVKRTRSNLQLSSMPHMPYTAGDQSPLPQHHAKYNSLSGRATD